MTGHACTGHCQPGQRANIKSNSAVVVQLVKNFSGFTGLVHKGLEAYLAEDVDDVALFQAQLVLVRGLKCKHDLAVLLS